MLWVRKWCFGVLRKADLPTQRYKELAVHRNREAVNCTAHPKKTLWDDTVKVVVPRKYASRCQLGSVVAKIVQRALIVVHRIHVHEI